MDVVSLTTDFGIKDGNVGTMKGVIWGIAPRVQIADLSHTISPQNIAEAALIILRAVPYFPPGSTHIVVVDPGVGTQRRPIAARIGKQTLVAPDNGVLTMLIERAERLKEPMEFIHLDRPQYWLSEVSHVFHGRDIFAPVGAHLAAGVPLRAVGSRIKDPVRLELPKPSLNGGIWAGQVIHIDHFGNIHTNLRVENLGDSPESVVSLCGVEVHGLVETFGDLPAGKLAALYGSSGDLIISVVNGNAAERLKAGIGDAVHVKLG